INRHRTVSAMALLRPDSRVTRQLLQFVLLHTAWEVGSGQVRYSVPEESKHGTFVGRLAQDLGLEVAELVSRMFRMVSKGRRDYFEVNLQNGVLFVNSRVDREELCGQSPLCAIDLEVIVDKPLRIFHVEVEIQDINDNAPVFSGNEKYLSIAESRLPDSRVPVEGASDADIGTNSLLTYKLSPSEHFTLNVKSNDDDNKKSLVLVLKKPLDREETPEHHLLLTATDAGKPKLTGTIQLVITVLDANDNAPVFNQTVYKIRLFENAANGTLVIKLNATDLDEGSNKDVSYIFSSFVTPTGGDMFSLDPNTGEVTVKSHLDFEEINVYDIQVEVKDKGNPPLSGHCNIELEVLDVNDNAPELTVTSLSLPVPEDSPPGTVVALVSVSDRDSGDNGKVTCSIPPNLPFQLVSTFKNYHSLVLAEAVDRERVSEYKILVTARDEGSPSLSASSSILVPIADVNDNAPAFPQPVYTVFVKENNPPGAHLFSVSASDPDLRENAFVSYSVVARSVGEQQSLSSYISVHSENGHIYALQPFDYEELQVLQFQVSARDAGFPSLCGNVTVQLFVLDENDNAPAVSPPGSGRGSPGPELVPLSAGAGHVVGKIRAVDADSGYNAWLRYEVQEPGAAGPFRVGVYSGEISTTRALEEADGPSQRLVILVRDHGEPALSATATISLSLVESPQAVKWDSRQRGGSEGPLVDMNVSLMIAICSLSGLFVLVIVVYVGLRCHPGPEVMLGPGKATVVCSSEVGSGSYCQRQSRNLCVGEGTAKNDLMVFSPNFPNSAANGDKEKQQEMTPNLCGTVSDVLVF
ncbi:protocadherin alpha-3-like, partial [Macrochelys suwanniensis]